MNKLESIDAILSEHKGEKRILLRFAWDQQLINSVKSIPDARWSATKNCWHIPDTEVAREALKQLKTLFQKEKNHASTLQMPIIVESKPDLSQQQKQTGISI